jgi:hypothetical protein
MASLTLETQLNVEADKLAMEFLQANKPQPPITLLFLWAKCQLTVNEKSITRKLQQSLRFLTGSIEICQNLLQRNLWTEQTLANIHWDVHEAGHSSH